MYDSKQKNSDYEIPIRGDPVTLEEHREDIDRLDISAEEKARRFTDDMPVALDDNFKILTR